MSQKSDFEKEVKKAMDDMISKGFPLRTSAYAASMGFLRNLKKK